MKRSQVAVERNTIPYVTAVPPEQPGPAPGQAPAGDMAPAPAVVPAVVQEAMPFPGPLAFVPRPPAMLQDPAQSPATAASDQEAAVTALSGGVFTFLEMDEVNPFGLPPFHLAASNGDLAGLNRLLENREVDIDAFDGKYASTALMSAAASGQVAAVSALVAAGAALDLVSPHFHMTALMQAVFAGQTDTVACLLAAGADVNHASRGKGRTALMLAIDAEQVPIVRKLLQRPDIALNQTDSAGYSALFYAVANNLPAVVQCLLAARANMTLAAPDGKTALAMAVDQGRTAVVEAFMLHGARLEGVDFFDTAHGPFTVTLADLQAELQTPGDPDTNPLGMANPERLDQPLVFIDQLIAVLESDGVLLAWLRNQGLRMTCALPVALCIASLPESWNLLANSGRAVNQQQKRWYCASALSRLRVLTKDGDTVQAYRAAGISGASIQRLTMVANHQVEKVIAVAEQVLTSLGSAMFENLVHDCLARTDLAHQVDCDALSASLVNAGFLRPVADVIATGWQSALAVLGEAPALVPTGCTGRQLAQFMRDGVAATAPEPFRKALQRELALPALLKAFRILVGTTKEANALDLMFQIQCDQIRQYCAFSSTPDAEVASGETEG